MSDLAIHLGLDKSTISGLVGRAEKRGLVRGHRTHSTGAASTSPSPKTGIELAERGAAKIAQPSRR